VLTRDRNHPCIIAWVPANESWGVPDLATSAQQRAHLDALYSLTHALDPTRLVVSNDGWEHTTSDLLTLHDYDANPAALASRYRDAAAAVASAPGGRGAYAPEHGYRGEPILLTEFGGIAWGGHPAGWGYSTAASADDFVARYAALVAAVEAAPSLSGFCYTQLYDVEQEINGLATADRVPKAPADRIRAATRGRAEAGKDSGIQHA
jgi:hypothetical protein